MQVYQHYTDRDWLRQQQEIQHHFDNYESYDEFMEKYGPMENPELFSFGALDQYLWNLASKNGKSLGGIETVEEQVNILDSFQLKNKFRCWIIQ